MASTVEYSAGQGVKRHLPSILCRIWRKDGVCRSINAEYGKRGVCGRITDLPRPRRMPAARGLADGQSRRKGS
ncbi:hypothetical protein [Peribacillus simplex]|uniref:hypothetical protein n=1 Tax=Peribacillus simplex TaxID=1478 RepID=UPI0024C1A6F9|nr:hypothetical protein [Peribacillus simplex]WHX90830.1 hypothetical protein QNH50_23110 [Peribacillus simplex]